MALNLSPLALRRLVGILLALAFTFVLSTILVPSFHHFPMDSMFEKDGFYDFAIKDGHRSTCLRGMDWAWLVFCCTVAVGISVIEPLVAFLSKRLGAKRAHPHLRPSALSTSVRRAGLFLDWTWRKNVALFLIGFLNVFTIVQPCVTGRASFKEQPYWVEYADADPPATVPTAARLAYWFGAFAAWPAMANFVIALFPVARTTPVLSLFGLGYDEAMWVHILCSRLAIIWSFVHSALCQLPALKVSTWLYWYSQWYPVDGPGFWIWAGQMSMILFLLILVSSVGWVRRRFYNSFRVAHMLFIPALVFLCMHIRYTYFWFLLPLNFWFTDLAIRYVWKHTRCKIALTTLSAGSGSGDRAVLLDVKCSASCAIQPGDEVFLMIPALTRFEWHPFTVLDVDRAQSSFRVLCKVLGDWTSDLYELATECEKEGPQLVDANIEGPYDAPSAWIDSIVAKLRAGQQVTLVGGGVGITGLAGALQAACSSTGAPHLAVVWITRDSVLLPALQPLLMDAARSGADVTVYLTAADPGEEQEFGESASASELANEPSGSGQDKLEKASDSADSYVHVPRSARRSPWLLAGMYALLMCVTTLATAGLWVAGNTAACWRDLEPARLEELRIEYMTTVNETYFRETGKHLINETDWPEEQKPFDDMFIYNCPLFANRNTEAILYDVTMKDEFPYGRPGDLPFDNGRLIGACWGYAQAMNSVFSIIAGMTVPILKALVLKAIVGRLGGPALAAASRHDRGADQPQPQPTNLKGASFNFRVIHARPDLKQLAKDLNREGGEASSIYLCGPPGLKRAVRRALAWVPALGSGISVKEVNHTL